MSDNPNSDLGFTHTRNFPLWLDQNKCSVVVSTYKKHKLLCLGVQGTGEISLAFVNVLRPMGICYDAPSQTFYTSNVGNVITYINAGEETHSEWGYFDAVFMPTKASLCGDIDIHDLRLGKKSDDLQPRLYYISACFNSILMSHDSKPFEVYWTPNFITKTPNGLPPCEDRCHLNGLALLDGKPKYVTAACTGDHYYAWKEQHGTGVVIDVETNEIIANELWAPHSPTLYNGKLYIAEAGTGQFGYIDVNEKKFIAKKFIPGFIRGMAFINNYALINTSNDRHDQVFKDIPLGKLLELKNQKAYCGISIVDLQTFDILHRLEFADTNTELYDIAIMPNIKRARFVEITDLPSNKVF